jgi:tRNA (guanine-N7-)-methyltransferase
MEAADQREAQPEHEFDPVQMCIIQGIGVFPASTFNLKEWLKANKAMSCEHEEPERGCRSCDLRGKFKKRTKLEDRCVHCKMRQAQCSKRYERTLEDGNTRHTARQRQHRPKWYMQKAGKITDAQRKGLKSLWPMYGLNIAFGEPLDLSAAFPDKTQAPLLLDIGFGMGDSVLGFAEHDPSWNYLGVEWHRPGLGETMIKLKNRSLQNVRLIGADAMKFLSDDSGIIQGQGRLFDRICVFFPDPWKEKRDEWRRIAHPSMVLERLPSLVKMGGALHLATDVGEYAGYAWTVLTSARAREVGWRWVPTRNDRLEQYPVATAGVGGGAAAAAAAVAAGDAGAGAGAGEAGAAAAGAVERNEERGTGREAGSGLPTAWAAISAARTTMHKATHAANAAAGVALAVAAGVPPSCRHRRLEHTTPASAASAASAKSTAEVEGGSGLSAASSVAGSMSAAPPLVPDSNSHTRAGDTDQDLSDMWRPLTRYERRALTRGYSIWDMVFELR